MMKLLKQQKDTLVKMSLLQKLQQDLQQEVAQFRQVKNEELRKLEEQRQQQQRELRQLEEIKKQTADMYNNMETKMQKDDASGRLEDITRTQDNLVKTLTDYKYNLNDYSLT
ncbi:hypothetical protein Btru_049270 [Bulinus truncatus]|nr:hypothetical protein Btru_049270 [Bulinus truncatus]